MIFVQKKAENTHTKLSTALGALQIKDNQEQKLHFRTTKNFLQTNKYKKDPIRRNDNKVHEYLLRYSNNETSKNKRINNIFKKYNNKSVKLRKNPSLFSNESVFTPYDPYLINVCKNAIIRIKNMLPNYKDIINKINAEFGIIDNENNIPHQSLYSSYTLNHCGKKFKSHKKFYSNEITSTFASKSNDKDYTNKSNNNENTISISYKNNMKLKKGW